MNNATACDKSTNYNATEWWFDSCTDVKQLREYIHGLERRRDGASVRWGDAENRAAALAEALAELADLVGGMNVDPIEGTTTIGGQYATVVVSALTKARAALAAARGADRQGERR